MIAAFPSLTDDGPGLIARYARGADYHTVVAARLEAIRDELGVIGTVRVDSSPVPEVMAARMAGVGKTGRHGLCIVPGYGSYVALGAIVLDRGQGSGFRGQLLTDAGFCGGCGECVRACPTGALGGERLDRERCLSFITQAKTLTAVQEALLKAHPRHWGCDTCQEACPENKNAAMTALPEFNASGAVREYCPGMDIDDRAFAWRGRDVLERNYRLSERDTP